MGQYKFIVSFELQLGVLIKLNIGYELVIQIPFVTFYIGLTSHAQGVNLFGVDIKKKEK